METFVEFFRTRSAAGVAVAATALLAACAALVTVQVQDFTLPAGTTRGQACFQRVEAESALSGVVRTASYQGDATYSRSGGIGSDEIQISFYGRTTDPGSECIDEAAEGNVALSDPITLVVNDTERIVVGEGDYGPDVASVVSAGTFWLGASVHDESLSVGQSVAFSNGRVTVGF